MYGKVEGNRLTVLETIRIKYCIMLRLMLELLFFFLKKELP